MNTKKSLCFNDEIRMPKKWINKILTRCSNCVIFTLVSAIYMEMSKSE